MAAIVRSDWDEPIGFIRHAEVEPEMSVDELRDMAAEWELDRELAAIRDATGIESESPPL
jgi:hypothetical protein